LARSKVAWAAGAAGLAVVLYLAFGLFGVQALFVDNEVNEGFAAGSSAPEPSAPEEPGEEAATADAEPAPDASDGTRRDSEGATTERDPAEEPVAEERTEPSGPVAISSGDFHPVDHGGSGTATVYRLEDGSHVLRLTDLNVENGPDLYVYAVAAPDAHDEVTVFDAGFVNLGMLKGNVGNQTYALPEDFDPEVHRSVSVWCQRFSSNFATAPLDGS